MRGAWAILAIMLGGCVPPPIVVASYAADGVSYAGTGKSVSDHGLSAITDQDCATLRVFTGRAICEDRRHPPPAAPLEAHGTAATDRAASGGGESGVHYLKAGSFPDRPSAEALARRFLGYPALILKTARGGRDAYLVVIGPLDGAQWAALRAGQSAPLAVGGGPATASARTMP